MEALKCTALLQISATSHARIRIKYCMHVTHAMVECTMKSKVLMIKYHTSLSPLALLPVLCTVVIVYNNNISVATTIHMH